MLENFSVIFSSVEDRPGESGERSCNFAEICLAGGGHSPGMLRNNGSDFRKRAKSDKNVRYFVDKTAKMTFYRISQKCCE
jgi:hypothetical protein